MAKMNSPAGGDFGADLSPGTRVGGARFILKRRLGCGETSEVWLARDVKAVEDVALKFLPRVFRSDENLLERLKEKVQHLQQLKHPHIVTVRELVVDYDSVAVAMEFVDGWSLAALKVDKLCRCYDVEEIEPWIRQLVAAVAYAHNECGEAHGDLKPANLLVSAREGIKISDFGLAALVRSESSRRGLTRGISGDMGFLSPQQVMGGLPSESDDVYSLGATIFDLLTGTPPFYQGEIIAQICSLQPPSISERLRELEIQSDPISPVWEDTVAACLAKKPADRPARMGELLPLLDRTDVTRPAAPALPPEKSATTEETDPEVPAGTSEPGVNPPAAELRPADEVRRPVAWSKRIGAAALLMGVVLFAVLGLVLVAKRTASSPPGKTAPAAAAPGSRDGQFNVGSGADDAIRCLAVQPDGKIVVGGQFSFFNGVPNHRIVRLNPDGSLDAPFGMQPPGRVHAVALQSDGKILMAGETMVPKRPHAHVTRLFGNSQREPNWGLSLGFDAEVRALAVQPDGKILVGGSFMTVSGNPHRRLLRLNSDGGLDETFDIGEGAAGPVWSLAVQPDGKILVTGAFERFNGRNAGRLVRLKPDGQLDTAFPIEPGADGDIMGVALQADGRILIGGKFATVNGLTRPHVARLNPDGRVDTGFNPGQGPNEVVQSVVVQPNGKILLGGGFDQVNGVIRHGVARLNPDGSLDRSFNNGEGASGYVWRVATQPDGKILVGGAFDHFGGEPCGKLVRLLP